MTWLELVKEEARKLAIDDQGVHWFSRFLGHRA